MTKARSNDYDWLKARLKELKPRGKGVNGLAAHLGLDQPRGSEIVSGRRRLQDREILPAAEYLEWPAERLLHLITYGRYDPSTGEQDLGPREERSFVTGVTFGLNAAGLALSADELFTLQDRCREAWRLRNSGEPEDAVLARLRKRNDVVGRGEVQNARAAKLKAD